MAAVVEEEAGQEAEPTGNGVGGAELLDLDMSTKPRVVRAGVM